MNEATTKMAEAVGLKPSDYRALAERVRLNHGVLQSCRRHAFQLIPTSRPMFQRYRCADCGGEVDAHAFHWYTLGMQHARG